LKRKSKTKKREFLDPMKRMRKCNDDVYQLAKEQALVKKLKNKRFRPFCLCLPDVIFVHLYDFGRSEIYFC
jgi:hypothetical protein